MTDEQLAFRLLEGFCIEHCTCTMVDGSPSCEFCAMYTIAHAFSGCYVKCPAAAEGMRRLNGERRAEAESLYAYDRAL